MKKRIICILALCTILLGIIVYFPIKASLNNNGKMRKWSQVLKEQYEEGRHASTEKEHNKIVKRGKDINITQDEVEQAKEFYIIQGFAEEEAEDKALEYMGEYNAMYVEAINCGFDVSEKEIDEYITELKEIIKSSPNEKELNEMMASFGSEEEYWDYQRQVCKKQLPIQKYNEYNEKKFKEENSANLNAEQLETAWEKEFIEIKKKACKKQHYTE